METLDQRLIAAPATEPVSLTEAKLHCRVDSSAEDTLISALITAARVYVENDTGAALITQTWSVYLDAWPTSVLRLPHAPVSAVASITYTDEDGVSATLAASAYTLRTGFSPVQVIFDADALPTVALADVAGIVVQYTAGYGAAAAVPGPFYQAMLLLIGHWYRNREALAAGNAGPMAFAVDALLEPYRLRWYGDWVI